MLWGNEKRVCLLYAITPIHAGAGQALSAVDLPIQREEHTAWPMVQASGIKGALRDWCEKSWGSEGFNEDLPERIFGRAGEEESNWAGAVTVTDARILLFPVRSNVAPFVHITCPAVLNRFEEILDLAGFNRLSLPSVNEDEFVSLKGDFPDEIVLEDMVVKKKTIKEELKELSVWFEQSKRCVIVSDDVFGFLVRTSTEVQAHIAIEDSTGTARDGSLRYQEYLPADSLLYFLAFFADERGRKDGFKLAEEVARLVTEHGVVSHLQIGGDFTLGKGICKVKWISPENKGGNQS